MQRLAMELPGWSGISLGQGSSVDDQKKRLGEAPKGEADITQRVSNRPAEFQTLDQPHKILRKVSCWIQPDLGGFFIIRCGKSAMGGYGLLLTS